MGMSAWGIFAAPFLAAAPVPDQIPAHNTEPTEKAAADGDIFGAFSPMDEISMSESSGGADTAVNIDDFGINIADNDGSVSNVNTNANTGAIGDNLVSGNGGITTVYFNTGNGVIFQNNVNVNIFLNDGS